FGRWWWASRGYTPAGVEAWNGIRALDYLETRPEVDRSRIGITGRSGGGAYSWWIAALDDRIKVAVPTAGITTLKNHILDGAIDWLNRFLKGGDRTDLIDEPARKAHAPRDLKVLEKIPDDEKVTKADEFFVPAFSPPPENLSATEWVQRRDEWLRELKHDCF